MVQTFRGVEVEVTAICIERLTRRRIATIRGYKDWLCDVDAGEVHGEPEPDRPLSAKSAGILRALADDGLIKIGAA